MAVVVGLLSRLRADSRHQGSPENHMLSPPRIRRVSYAKLLTCVSYH
jgi:hypothetical protein